MSEIDSGPGVDEEKEKEKAKSPVSATFWTVVATFLASVIGVGATFYTQMLVGRSQHAMEFYKAFTENQQNITSFMSSSQRKDEQSADMSLTVMYDFAQTYEDRIAMLTIAARMLNATDCPSSGEATARFLGIVVRRIKHDAADDARNPFGSRDNARLLDFVRSQPFLDLAADDVPLAYFNDEGNGPIFCGPTPDRDKPNSKTAAIARSEPTLSPLFTPSASDPRNHTTFWGERASWNEAKNGLFKELRPDDFAGWIHIATWETNDACVDAAGKHRAGVQCTPIRVHYTSGPFTFLIREPNSDVNARSTFWLGRARFLRDSSPHVYAHYDDANLPYRGVLGHLLGIVNYGECVRPVTRPRYYSVSTANGLRHFIHASVKVHAESAQACWPDQ